MKPFDQVASSPIARLAQKSAPKTRRALKPFMVQSSSSERPSLTRARARTVALRNASEENRTRGEARPLGPRPLHQQPQGEPRPPASHRRSRVTTTARADRPKSHPSTLNIGVVRIGVVRVRFSKLGKTLQLDRVILPPIMQNKEGCRLR